MSSQALCWVVGDRLPSLYYTFRYADTGTAIDLTGATVTFITRARGSTGSTTTRSVTVVTAASGYVRYDPEVSFTATAGSYEGRFVATFPGSLPLSDPNQGSVFYEINAAIT